MPANRPGSPFAAGAVINMGSGNNSLLIDTAITGTGNQNYTTATISNFNYNTDTIILPSIYGLYTATYVVNTLTINGSGATYVFNMPGAVNIPAPVPALSIVPALQYSFVTPDDAAAISGGPSLTTPPVPTTQTYDGAYYFGATAPTAPVCSVICFSGNSIILAKNKFTEKIEYIKASDLYSDTHQVYSENNNIFVDVKYNIIVGPTKRFIRIKKDSLGKVNHAKTLTLPPGTRSFIMVWK